jgi:2-polyprenyl-3-methyl-5-hydroxy-6-metoxy-1,4-benzoquinol methylase
MNTQLELEKINKCPVCGSDNVSFLFYATDKLHGIPGKFEVNECLDCKAIYLSSRPTLKTLPMYYPDDYSPHQVESQIAALSLSKKNIKELIRNTILYEIYHREGYKNEYRITSPIIAKLFAALLFPFHLRAGYTIPKNLFPNHGENKKSLDIGCSTGVLMLTLQKLGFEVYGIEPAEKPAQAGREQFGLNIKVGTLLDYKFPDNYFHLITMIHVFEHIHNPIEILKEAKRILHPNGKIIIKMPNADSLGYKKFKYNWMHLDFPRHFIIYREKTIKSLIDIVGLKLEKYMTITRKHNLFGSLRYYLNDDNIRTGTINFSLFQKITVELVNLQETVLIMTGKHVGEEMQVVLTK